MPTNIMPPPMTIMESFRALRPAGAERLEVQPIAENW